MKAGIYRSVFRWRGRSKPGGFRFRLAQVLVSKYGDPVPLYRQERVFERAGLAIARSTPAQWGGACGVQLQPWVDVLKQQVLRRAVLCRRGEAVWIRFRCRGPAGARSLAPVQSRGEDRLSGSNCSRSGRGLQERHLSRGAGPSFNGRRRRVGNARTEAANQSSNRSRRRDERDRGDCIIGADLDPTARGARRGARRPCPRKAHVATARNMLHDLDAALWLRFKPVDHCGDSSHLRSGFQCVVGTRIAKPIPAALWIVRDHGSVNLRV